MKNITATYSRVSGENVGSYTISAALAPVDKVANYQVTYNTALFTIGKSDLAVSIKVNDTYVNQGTAPSFTFTTTPTVTVTSVTYQVRNSSGVLQTNLSNLSAGTYSVTAVNPVITNSSNINYIVTSVPGTLIVNPTSGNLKSSGPYWIA